MRFDRESWRKLYVVESVTHRMLPLFTRGLRDYLLRHAEDDGTILRGSNDNAADLARVLCATQQERKQIEAALQDLFSIGYLASLDGRLWIVKFAEAQSPRSPGAKRQAKYVASLLGDAPGDALNDAPPDSESDEKNDAQNDSILDETRRDEIRSIREVFACWQEVHAHRNAKLDAKRASKIRARLREGFTTDQLKTALRGAKLDGWLMGENPDGKVYDGLESLLKDAAKVERLLEITTKPDKGRVIEVK